MSSTFTPGFQYLGGNKDAFLAASGSATHKQAFANSCWACAARHIVNFYAGKATYVSDATLCNDLGKTYEINTQSSAAAALGDLGYASGADDAAIPTEKEIGEAIAEGKPLLANIGAPKGRDIKFKGGHWVVIVGIDQTQKPAKLAVFDPATGTVDECAYDDAMCNLYSAESLCWKNTSYIDDK